MLTTGITLLTTAAVPYAVYLVGIRFGKKLGPRVPLTERPPITVIVAAYNEEKNVERCIGQIVQSYPKAEIIFVDDHSNDRTFWKAKNYLDAFCSNYQLISNVKQLGPAGAYNEGLKRATTEIIVTVDADILFDHMAIWNLIERLMSDPKIGAVCGELQPLIDEQLSKAEGSYRSFYGRMSEWDSANGSTFNFNGALIAFKRSAVKDVSSVGADDANTAFAAISNGYRAVYEKDAIVYERIPEKLGIQFKQKTRRAAGLLRSVWDHAEDAQTFRIWMLFASPILFLTGSLLTLISLDIRLTIVLMAILVLFAWSFTISFVLNQIYLTVGLFKMFKVKGSWQSTSSSSHG